MSRIRKIKGIWDFNEYMEYIESIKDSIPTNIRDFVADEKRYMFNSLDTLYDAQLISIKFCKNGICVLFVAPYYDKFYKFVFKDVSKLVMSGIPDNLMSLLIHEFSVKNTENYTYRFVFFCGTEVKISCSKIDICEQKISENIKRRIISE